MTGWIFDTNVDFNLIRMLMVDIMTVRQVGFLIRMLMLSHLYMKVNDWIFDTNVNIDIMTV